MIKDSQPSDYELVKIVQAFNELRHRVDRCIEALRRRMADAAVTWEKPTQTVFSVLEVSGCELARLGDPSPDLPMPRKPSALVDTRVIYCGDCLDRLRTLPGAGVDLIYIDPPFNSDRNYEVFWGETKEKWSFEDRHSSIQACIEYMRPRWKMA